MSSSRLNSRLPSALVLLGLLAGAYYLFGFQRLTREVAALDRPLMQVWDRYLATNAVSRAAGLRLDDGEFSLRRLRAAAGALDAAGRQVNARLELPADIRDKMRELFQLLDFQDERHQRVTQLARLAGEKGVALEVGATNGFPEYAIDMPQPTLLWPRLYIAQQLLFAAVHAKVGALRNLSQLSTVSHRATADDTVFLQELPMRLELVGSMEAVNRFLVSLPLRGAELKAVGLADALTNKPALFIDQVLLRKHSAERPHDVLLDLTVAGFVRWSNERARPATVK
jgi:hypothetical protein